jgi:hypothetical protein
MKHLPSRARFAVMTLAAVACLLLVSRLLGIF